MGILAGFGFSDERAGPEPDEPAVCSSGLWAGGRLGGKSESGVDSPQSTLRWVMSVAAFAFVGLVVFIGSFRGGPQHAEA